MRVEQLAKRRRLCSEIGLRLHVAKGNARYHMLLRRTWPLRTLRRSTSIIRPVVASLGVLALLLAGCGGGETGSSGDSPKREGGPPYTEAKTSGNCPGFLAIGLPTKLAFTVKNTGSEDWPATFITFSEGLDSFVVNGGLIEGDAGEKVDTPAFDTYGFGPLRRGEEVKVEFMLTPAEAGNIDLTWGAWGDEKKASGIVPNFKRIGCDDLAINP